MRVEPRLRVFAAATLWPIATRAVLVDGAKITWGTTLALLSALFLFGVARSQIRWLGKPPEFWWDVACRADIALFASRAVPEAYLLPLAVFIGAFRATRLKSLAPLCRGGVLWRGAPLVLLLCPYNPGYIADVVGVALVLGYRSREPNQVHSAKDFHTEAELRVAGDAVGCYIAAAAGSPLPTRLALLAGTGALLGLAFTKPKNLKMDAWDEQNTQTRKDAPMPFRNL